MGQLPPDRTYGAYITFRLLRGWGAELRRTISAHPGVVGLSIDNRDQSLSLVIEAGQKMQLAELVGSAIRAAERFGAAFHTVIASYPNAFHENTVRFESAGRQGAEGAASPAPAPVWGCPNN